MAGEPSLEAQAKGLRLVARALVLAGLIVGVGFPLLLSSMKIEIARIDPGFDVAWLIGIVLMLIDFVLAAWFARRAANIERSIPPA